ncbi:MAG: AraC family transcriptional regulator [Gammaproteobacteria bacterium]|nr:MAG: AraC family transcriptional regulator [Gammaproteobacteria bacterium]
MNTAASSRIASRTAQALLRVVRESGHSPEDALRHCELPASLLVGEPADISTLAYSRLYRYVIDLLQDESFGINLKQKMPPGSFRMMCLFIIHCKTLGEAIHRAAEFFHFCQSFREDQPARPVRLRGRSSETVVIALGYPTAKATTHPSADASMIYMMLNFYRWLVDNSLPVQAIHLAHAPAGKHERYPLIFDEEIVFGAECNGFEIGREALDFPVAQNEETLKDFLRSAPYPLIQPYTPSQRKNLVQAIRSQLIRNMGHPDANLGIIAEQLGMTPRTIHRKLASQGTSFRALKDEVLRETALHYLDNADLSIDAIATLMGFRESSAFYRSFRRWTGRSPGEYRKHNLQKTDNARENTD